MAKKVKKIVKHRVARDWDGNTKTKSEFFGNFRSAIRKIWMYSGIRKQAMAHARIAPNKYLCEKCKHIFKSTEVEVNHIIPAGALSSFEHFSPFIERMFPITIEHLEVLCKPCHSEFTKEERSKQ